MRFYHAYLAYILVNPRICIITVTSSLFLHLGGETHNDPYRWRPVSPREIGESCNFCGWTLGCFYLAVSFIAAYRVTRCTMKYCSIRVLPALFSLAIKHPRYWNSYNLFSTIVLISSLLEFAFFSLFSFSFRSFMRRKGFLYFRTIQYKVLEFLQGKRSGEVVKFLSWHITRAS